VKPTERTQMKLKVIGNAKSPDIRIASVGGQVVEDVKQQAVETGKELLQSQLQQQTGVNVDLDKFKKDSIQKALQNQKAKAEQRAKDSIAAVRKKLEDEAKRKEAELKKKAEEEAKKKLNDLKNKIGFPK
jgi:membrane protein involved in colicin uptake